MAKNQLYPNALHIAVPAPVDVKSGAPVQIGKISGVAQIDAKAGEKVTVWLDGSWNIDVTGAIANIGDPIYITAEGELTVTATDNTPWGVALETKTAALAPAEVVPLGYTAGATA